jgi:poly-gamma-glutamate synthesis protein (capsule biosynthesis protein)
MIAAVLTSAVAVARDQPPIPSMYSDASSIMEAITREQPRSAVNLSVTGISVPHHLLAADLIARGFWAASTGKYDRIVLLSPDHFNRSRLPLATTRRNFRTVFGLLENDLAATDPLLEAGDLFEDSDLFEAEHGISALLPFVKHFFPSAKIVPIAISSRSTRADWDRAVTVLEKMIGPRVLVVQSTDYSHYRPLSVAVQRDQETLNIIAANDADAVERLIQVSHMDSKAAQYLQMRLQSGALRSHGVVVANRNSEAYGTSGLSTTSYIVSVYTQTPAAGSQLRYNDQRIVYFGGDAFFGRLLNVPLSNSAVVKGIVAEVNEVTGGAPLIVNLESVLLEEPPENLPRSILVSHAGLAIPILKALNVTAVSTANNHSFDVGPAGKAETESILARVGIKPLRHKEATDLGAFRIIALNFIPGSYRETPLVTGDDLAELCRIDARPPLIVFAHWGEEFTASAGPTEYAAAELMHSCGVSAIVGTHSHRASAQIEALQGGEYQLTFSLGNLLFDQRSERSSGALLELRVFEQGTFATRLVPVPNLYEFGGALMRQLLDAPIATDLDDGVAR